MDLKTAQRHGWLEYIPDLSDPYRRQSRVEHRAWFTPKEYEQHYEATRQNVARPKNKRFKWHAEQLHDFVLIIANAGLRPSLVPKLLSKASTNLGVPHTCGLCDVTLPMQFA